MKNLFKFIAFSLSLSEYFSPAIYNNFICRIQIRFRQELHKYGEKKKEAMYKTRNDASQSSSKLRIVKGLFPENFVGHICR